MKERYKEDSTDSWNNWYLLNHYYREKDQFNYIEVAINFLRFHHTKEDDKYKMVYKDLKEMSMYDYNLDKHIKNAITNELI